MMATATGWCGIRLWASLCVFALLATSCGKPRQEPVLPQDVIDFEILYAENCSGCHGVDGKNGPGRPLNDPLYLSLIPKETLRQTIENGRPGTAMPAWARSQGGPLYPKQVAALVNGMQQNWAKPVNLNGNGLPPYSVDNDTGDAVRGKKLFLRDCFMCHGQGAPVGPVTDPSMLMLVSNQVLRTSIIIGRPDLGMPDFRTLNLGHALSGQDVADLVAYLTSLRPAISASEKSDEITPQRTEQGQGNIGEQPAGSSSRGGNNSLKTGAHVDENGSGQTGQRTKGNEGSGNGPGSPRPQSKEGNKAQGSSSQRGGR